MRDEWIDEEVVVYKHNAILRSHKKQWILVVCCILDRTGGNHVKWIKFEGEEQMQELSHLSVV